MSLATLTAATAMLLGVEPQIELYPVPYSMAVVEHSIDLGWYSCGDSCCVNTFGKMPTESAIQLLWGPVPEEPLVWVYPPQVDRDYGHAVAGLSGGFFSGNNNHNHSSSCCCLVCYPVVESPPVSPVPLGHTLPMLVAALFMFFRRARK